MSNLPTTPPPAPLSEAVARRLDEIVAQFTDRVALAGLVPLGAVPDALSEAERCARCERAGRAALAIFARRVAATTAAELDVGVAVLGLVPRLFCVPDADAPAPADVARFAATVAGRNLLARVEVPAELLPPSWRDCVDAVTAASSGLGPKRAHAARVAVTRLALLALAHGIRTASGIPSTARLGAWARAAGWGTRVVRDWRRGLRVAHQCLTQRGGAAVDGGAAALVVVWPGIAAEAPRTLRVALEQVGASHSELEAHARQQPGGEDALTAAAAAARRLRFGRAEAAMLHLLAVVAPHFVPLVTAPRAPKRARKRGRTVRPKTARNVLRSVDRMLAEYVVLHRAAPPRDLTPAALLTTRVPAAALRIPPEQEVGRAWAEANLGRPVEPPTVSLWHLLLDRQIDVSAARSPVVRARPADEPPAFTYTLAKDAKDLALALRRAAHAATVAGSEARRDLEQLVAAADEVTAFIMGRLLHDPEVAVLKDVAGFIRLITWPQLLVVGLPYLRARVWELRRQVFARPEFGAPAPDVAVYLGWLECYIVLATLCADPLRSQNWRNAWLGDNLLLSLDRSGPAPAIVAVQSHFTGDGGVNPASALKIEDAARPDARGRVHYEPRVRVHRWSPGITDFELFHDYLTLVRAPRLPRTEGGGVPDFADELRPDSLHHPLFVAPAGSAADSLPADAAEPRRATPMSEGMFRSRFARALHFVCRDVLGRPLPEWETFQHTHGAEFAFLIAPHIVRSACATYWLAVRRGGEVGDALDPAERDALRAAAARSGVPAVLGLRTAQYVGELLNDHVRTLRERYVAWPTDLAARMLEPCRDWEHPRAFDREMDRLASGVGVAREHDAELPLPPGRSVAELQVPEHGRGGEGTGRRRAPRAFARE